MKKENAWPSKSIICCKQFKRNSKSEMEKKLSIWKKFTASRRSPKGDATVLFEKLPRRTIKWEHRQICQQYTDPPLPLSVALYFVDLLFPSVATVLVSMLFALVFFCIVVGALLVDLIVLVLEISTNIIEESARWTHTSQALFL